MGIGRKFVSVSAAALLAGVSLIAVGGQANAVAAVGAIASVDEGQSTSISLSGCADTTLYSGATVVISDGVNTEQIPTPGTDFTFDTPADLPAGDYSITYTCVGYNGAPDSSATGNFTIFSTALDITPDSWRAGDTITITAEGFAAGETVSLSMTDKSTGKVVWTDQAVVAVDANGNLTYSFVLISDVPQGSYLLTATGDTSGKTRVAEFFWGSPDAPVAPPVTTPPVVTAPGLPSTGN